jgi:hypothetical protein
MPADGETKASNASPLTADPMQSMDKGLDHAWRYFALHAQQRISVFNFFIVLSGVLSTGIGAGFQAGRAMAPVVAILGALLALFSFVFYRLDERGSELVKLAEAALIAGETACLSEFARIIVDETKLRTSPSTRSWTFGRSFRLIFWVMGIAGIVSSSYAVCRSMA